MTDEAKTVQKHLLIHFYDGVLWCIRDCRGCDCCYSSVTVVTEVYGIGSNAVNDFLLKVSLIKTKFYHFDYVVMLAGEHEGNKRPHDELCDVVTTELRREY